MLWEIYAINELRPVDILFGGFPCWEFGLTAYNTWVCADATSSREESGIGLYLKKAVYWNLSL